MYIEYGMAAGLHEARQMVRSIEKQARAAGKVVGFQR
jgi:hypothetical protein